MNLMKNFGCTVTRVRRSGIDLSPSPDLALKFGDKLMVVGEKEGIKGVARLLGNNAKKLSDTDFFPIAMGIVLGVLFGKLNISFPGGLGQGCWLTVSRTKAPDDPADTARAWVPAPEEECGRLLQFLYENSVQPELWQDAISCWYPQAEQAENLREGGASCEL